MRFERSPWMEADSSSLPKRWRRERFASQETRSGALIANDDASESNPDSSDRTRDLAEAFIDGLFGPPVGGEESDRLPPDASSEDLSRFLIERAFDENSTSAWNALNARNLRALILFAHYQLGETMRSSIEPEDLVQEAWMRVIRRAKLGFRFEYRGSGSLQRWMCQLIRWITIDKARRNECAAGVEKTAPDADFERDDREDPNCGPATAVEAQDNGSLVRQAIDSLPRKYREAVLAREIEEASHAEIAERFGYTEANARKLCQRAREMLRDRLRGRDWQDLI